MSRTNNFYVIYGSNAVGIYDNYNLSLTCKKYVKSWNCKKFSTWEKAVEFAVSCADEADYGFEISIGEQDFSLNWLLYFKNFVLNM